MRQALQMANCNVWEPTDKPIDRGVNATPRERSMSEQVQLATPAESSRYKLAVMITLSLPLKVDLSALSDTNGSEEAVIVTVQEVVAMSPNLF